MRTLSPLLRATAFKTICTVLFTFLVFFTFSNSYADKIYKVQANDFLGKIVKRNYPTDPNISKEQAMVAILRANPEAFRGGNIHFLKRVDSLTLPTKETVALIPYTEALQTIDKHYTFFKRNKTGNFPPVALKRSAQKKDKDSVTNNDTKTDATLSTLQEITTAETETKKPITEETETSTGENTSLDSLSRLTSDTETTATENTKVSNDETKTTDTNSGKFDSLAELTEKNSAETDTSTATFDELSTLSELKTEAADTEINPSSSNNITQNEGAETEEKLAAQQKTTTLKADQLQELEKRKEVQNETLNQLDNKIKTLEGNLTNQSDSTKNQNETTPLAETEESTGQLETISSLDALTEADNNEATPLTETEESTGELETISDLNALAEADNSVEDTTTLETPTSRSHLLWLLLPLFAVLGMLWWWKKSTTATAVIEKPSISANKDQLVQNKTDFHHPQSSQPTPAQQKISVNDNKVLSSTNIDKNKDDDDDDDEHKDTNEQEQENANKEESAIKLDMAKAYQEMGYPEEAKEMLEEIIHEGTKQQKAIAESLLAVL